MAYLPPEAVREKYAVLLARDRKLRPILYGSGTIVFLLLLLERCRPTLLPELPCLVLMIACAVLALSAGFRLYFIWFCPVCGMPLYRRWNLLLGTKPFEHGFGPPDHCASCHTDFLTGESRRKK